MKRKCNCPRCVKSLYVDPRQGASLTLHVDGVETNGRLTEATVGRMVSLPAGEGWVNGPGTYQIVGTTISDGAAAYNSATVSIDDSGWHHIQLTRSVGDSPRT